MSVLRVLLAEDNPGDVVLFRTAVDLTGVRMVVDVARDGAEALEMLRRAARWGEQGMPDLVLLDLNLPRVPGMQVLRAIKSERELRRVPVIMLTSSRSPEDLRAAYASNANAFVVKPGTVEELCRLVRRIHGFWGEVCELPGSMPDLSDSYREGSEDGGLDD